MDRDELLALDKDALIELIMRLYERVTELEAELGRPPKTPGNSSMPPSAGPTERSSARCVEWERALRLTCIATGHHTL
jgi:hypothetical protein